MLNRSQVSQSYRVAHLSLLVIAAVLGLSTPLLAADVKCQFKAESEATEVHVIKDGQTQWAGSIKKGETKTLSIPEGPFTLISKIYNPNLKTTEDVRAVITTRLCVKQTLLVPFFPDSTQR